MQTEMAQKETIGKTQKNDRVRTTTLSLGLFAELKKSVGYQEDAISPLFQHKTRLGCDCQFGSGGVLGPSE